MTEQDGREPTVYARHRAELPERDDDATFRALLAQARHITGRTYETTLYDHMQAFRLLWRHLESTGYLQRVHDGAREQLDSGTLTAAEAADLELFLTVYTTVHGI
ncbi:hypothetical protein [Streptomyces sp. JJ36]|uniref:hypothetical protein n=1 Tax=Streptomyces sp. JJ36 TaxID=2736645 RepID=UPI001F222B9E|nr:hypothetical protein [Streptomyces sp. JJ36]MCF6521759.1 hypothetical protein [Streptomyces sp. JJ36]